MTPASDPTDRHPWISRLITIKPTCALQGGVPPSSEAVCAIPNALVALCLNHQGLKRVKETNTLQTFIPVFTSRKFLKSLTVRIHLLLQCSALMLTGCLHCSAFQLPATNATVAWQQGPRLCLSLDQMVKRACFEMPILLCRMTLQAWSAAALMSCCGMCAR